MPYHYLIHDEVFEKLSIPSEEKLGRYLVHGKKGQKQER